MPSKRPNANGQEAPDQPSSKRSKTNGSVKQAAQKQGGSSRPSSEEEKAILREWLDSRDQDPQLDNIFTVATFPVPKKRKGGKEYTGPVEQLHLGGRDHMAVAYKVSPNPQWNQLHKYKKFTLPNGDTHGLGSCVFVNHGDSSDETMDPDTQWKAQVLEVRALDENHVYLRVVWLEIPRELPMGAAKYHAANELVASNEMAIISANTVNTGFRIKYWDETNDDEPLPDTEYFWRQQFDRHSGQLSKLRKICICRKPYSPEEIIVKCDHCDNWLHATCIVEYTKKRYQKLGTANGKKSGRGSLRAAELEKSSEAGSTEARNSTQSPGRSGGAAKQREAQEVEVNISVPADGTKPRLLVRDAGSEPEDVREEDVRCLICESVIV